MKKRKHSGKGLQKFTVNLDCRNLRTEMLEGERYLVAPVVLMTEGVHIGSKGALLYRARDLDSYSPAWNHKPIVLNHPKKGIACTQDFLNQNKMGILLETDFNRGKQRAEAWFNERRTSIVSPKTLVKLRRKEMMEVSTGLFVDQKGESGKHNGQRYKAIAVNHKPDHLAVLTVGEGACSINDGGGLFQLNAKKKSRIKKYIDKVVAGKMLINQKRKDRAMKKTKTTKKKFVSSLIKNELTTFDEKDRAWLLKMESSQLRKLMPKKPLHIFNSQEDLDEVINETIEDRLAEEKRKNKKKELRDANRKVANSKSKNEDNDEDEDEEDDEEEPVTKNKKTMKGNKKKRIALNDFLQNSVPAELRPILKQALRAAATEEERLIKTIVANKASKWKAEDLKGLAPKLGSMYLDHLRSLASLVANASDEDEDDDDTTASYFGAAVPTKNSKDTEEEEEEGLELPTYNNARFSTDLKLGVYAGMGNEGEEDEFGSDDEE